MKVAIFYHVLQREKMNAYLLKAELNRRGHDVYIYYYDKIKNSGEKLDYVPDVVLTHGLRNESMVRNYTNIFNKKIYRIVNLQYEQVLSEVWHNSKLHIPKGLASNVIHLCWGPEIKKRLVDNKVPDDNALVVGSLSIDLARDIFEDIYKSKNYISKTFNLSPEKRWVLFISNFVVNNFTEEYRNKILVPYLGEYNTNIFKDIAQKSQDEIIRWIDKYLAENDCEFIYRIHPGEHYSVALFNLDKKYSNFHLIKDYSVKNWIKVCDNINTWMSTSIVESYFMNKNCSILRPFDVPKNIDIEIMKDAKYLKSYEEFCKYNLSDSKTYDFPIDLNTISKFYNYDVEKYAYEKICDLLEKIVDENLIMNLYKKT